MIDQFGRNVTYLRISVTELCNLRCRYCMPADGVCKKNHAEMLTEDEMIQAVEAAAALGITKLRITGGEPLLQSDFVAELFEACHAEGIHTCCESTFCMDWKEIQKVLPHTDLLISDIKHMDSKIHKKYTGVPNTKILKNLKRLAKEGYEMVLRIPVIPQVNDDMDNIKATADFILEELGEKVRTLQL